MRDLIPGRQMPGPNRPFWWILAFAIFARLLCLWIAAAFLILVALPVLVDAVFHNIRLTLAIDG